MVTAGKSRGGNVAPMSLDLGSLEASVPAQKMLSPWTLKEPFTGVIPGQQHSTRCWVSGDSRDLYGE